MQKLYISGILILIALITLSCERGTIDDIYTNPDAIVDYLQADPRSQETADPDFIQTGTFYEFSMPLEGSFGTKRFKVDLDSSFQSFTVDVGDTVFVNQLWAKEADATINYRNVYTLTIENSSGTQVTKKLVTDSLRAYKDAYLLQLGSFNSTYRGWVLWGTTRVFNLSYPEPNLSWNSQEKGALPANHDIIYKSDFESFTEGDSITVRYSGHSTDIAFLNINEDGTPRKIQFHYIDGNTQEAGWKVSRYSTGKLFYYYAGVEIYRFTTLSSSDENATTFFFDGLMYSIDNE